MTSSHHYRDLLYRELWRDQARHDHCDPASRSKPSKQRHRQRLWRLIKMADPFAF